MGPRRSARVWKGSDGRRIPCPLCSLAPGVPAHPCPPQCRALPDAAPYMRFGRRGCCPSADGRKRAHGGSLAGSRACGWITTGLTLNAQAKPERGSYRLGNCPQRGHCGPAPSRGFGSAPFFGSEFCCWFDPVANDPGCVKTLGGITAPGILGSTVMRRAKKRKNSSSARHYDQIRFRFHTTKTRSRHGSNAIPSPRPRALAMLPE